MFYVDVDLRALKAKGDYMQFRCAGCEKPLGVAFKRRDGAILILRFKCGTCGYDEELKIQPKDFWGLGSKDGRDALDELE